MRTNLKTISFTLGLALCLSASAQEKTLPLRQSMDFLKNDSSARCQMMEHAVSQARTEEDKLITKMSAATVCECYPAELDKAAQAHQGDTVSKDELLAMATKAITICTARQVRTSAEHSCREDKKLTSSVKDPQAHCQCFAEGVRALDDSQLAEAAQTAYKAHVAKARSRMNGEAEPAPQSTVFDNISDGCKKSVK